MTDRNIDIIAITSGSSEARQYFAIGRQTGKTQIITEQVDEMMGFPTDPEAIDAIPAVDTETLPLALHG